MSKYTQHWQQVYTNKTPDRVSWYQDAPACSLALVKSLLLMKSASIIDIGAGASLLADFLLEDGFSDLTLVDIAAAGLAHTRKRLGRQAADVKFVVADVPKLKLDRVFDVWHDRAALHFLTDPADQARYQRVLDNHLKPGGHAVISTFAVGGPLKCSGLDVVQYDGARLSKLLGPTFSLVREHEENHVTPWGSVQKFSYFLVTKQPRV